MRKSSRFFYALLFLLGVFLVSFTVSTDFSQDLGRHLALGKLITETHSVPKINGFSYTNTSFPFFNHHWLSEVIFFVVFRAGGMALLIVLKTVLIMSAMGIVYMIAIRYARPMTVVGVGLMMFPFLVERSDIRPELFGYVLFSLILWYLCSPTVRKKAVWLPIPIMILWINIHISFVFGFVLLFMHLLSVLTKWRKNSKEYVPLLRVFLVLVATILSMLLNPNGWKGIVYPLTIFSNYGYSIVENQTMFFLSRMVFNPLITYYYIFLIPVFVGCVLLIRKKSFIHAALLMGFAVFPLWQIRHLPFFVFIGIVFLSETFEVIAENTVRPLFKSRISTVALGMLGIIFGFLIWLFGANTYYQVFDMNKRFGWGTIENGKKALDYIEKHPPKGNIFNNFDNGGYLIYRLYPRYRVFVDNRPEAYPKEFFQDVYIPLQQKKETQQAVFNKYNIHTIIMTHTDQTPWAQTFLSRILGDNAWRMVYLDGAYVIFTDDMKMDDVRSDNQRLREILYSEENATGSIYLMNMFIKMAKVDLAKDAFLRAQKSNPLSCSMKRVMYEEYVNSPYFFQADELKRGSFWCF